ncbi:vang-like protein 2 [Daphnia pulicaria]|uniref:vang-like protein 2 n=1 Tax=Daphnia pulicaria TaxID=35523 RepID=UPI001EEA33B3|nr:vang-like protein 2 [Daphnia pulicaria]
MYDNMTTYMLSDSPESGSGSNHQIGGGNSSSNAPSLIGSPRSTPVFGNNGHALKTNGGLMMNGSSSGAKEMGGHQMWNNVGHPQQQMQSPVAQPPLPPPHHHRNNVIVDDREENQSLRSDHSNSMAGGLSSSNRAHSRSSRHQHQHSNRPLASTQSGKSTSSGHHRSHRSARAGQQRDHPISSSPMQTSAVLGDRSNNQHQEVIEVQILPQDDGWGDNATALTGNTSVASGSMDDVSRLGGGDGGRGGGGDGGPNDPAWSSNAMGQFQSQGGHLGWNFKCQRYLGSITAAVLAVLAVMTPVAMVLLPRMQIVPLRSEQLRCPAECEGLLITLTVKLVLLVLGSWAVFWRPTRATMPRIFFLRTLVLLLVFVTTFAYCLFYGVRVVEQQDQLDYKAIVTFALSLVDALLFVHYAAVLLLEIRQMPPRYYLHVIRSPDGISRGYPIGAISIQRAAVWLLDKYYTEFPIYNPFLERLPPRRSRSKLAHSSSFKFYDLDAQNNHGSLNPGNARGVLSTTSSSTTARRNNSSHNERFYEEHEYERRLKKRRARLVTSAEEAFTHIRRLQAEPGPAVPMDPYEAAQAIFPSMARPLQKYLRITRQQPRHTVESILQHLAICLSHDLSARAFVEKFLAASPVMQNDKEKCPIQTWSLVCDVLLSRGIEDGTVFQLRQGDVSLLCRISNLPHFNITEEIIEPKSNKFVLRLSSETSV